MHKRLYLTKNKYINYNSDRNIIKYFFLNFEHFSKNNNI